MKIKFKDKTIFIADGSPNAKKIALGYDFSVDAENNITVHNTQIEMENKYQFANAIKNANSIPEIKNILLKLTKFIDVSIN